MKSFTHPDPILDKISQRVIDLACELQQIPSPTGQEKKRAEHLLSIFRENQLAQSEIDSAGNVIACLPGSESKPGLVVSAHLDTVFPLEQDLSLSTRDSVISGPGIGDNSLGLASLLGLVWLLKERGVELPGDVWFAATVGEEGLGNLKGMRAVTTRFGSDPLAYLILEGMGLGEVFHRGLAVQRYRIIIQTSGGHAWIDYGKPSANHELGSLISRLASLHIPRSPRCSLNVGVIQGGTSINTIASKAELELDLRSTQAEGIRYLTGEVERMVKEVNRPGVVCQAEVIGQRPGGTIPKGSPLVRLACNVLDELGIRAEPGIGSTDANVPISYGYPAICIGITTGNGAHTRGEFIRTSMVPRGLEQVFQIANRIWNQAD